jgi:aspartyl-tRNA(Asn)/glutamyl-tRNA(Gln) amidotransferase subunit B
MEFEAIIGLEVHAQLLTRSKLFCGCGTRFGAPPNSNTCPVCLGLPGALPVLNRSAVTMAVRAALALGCVVNPVSIFARKNYFYPDLPKGYQISQYDRPLAEAGRVRVLSGERTGTGRIVSRKEKIFRVTRLHLEEDAGKSLHGEAGSADESTCVDLNRSGVPLVEIVSEPDFRSSQEAYDYLTHLRKTLLYLGVCDGNMEEGSLRCDANVSVRPRGADRFGTKVEIKNLNSFRYLQKALDYEIDRQSQALAQSGAIAQETRLWDETRACTFPMRSKEEAHDYRYFPEPDLPPLRLDPEWLEDVRLSLPELPEARLDRFMQRYQLPADDALLLSSTPRTADYFEECAGLSGNPRAAANWIMGELTHALKDRGKEIETCPLPASYLAELIQMIDRGAISGKIAKSAFEEMYSSGARPEAAVRRLGLVQISDEAELIAMIERIKGANPKQLVEYRSGKEKLFGYFAGQVMKETKGQANPKLLNELLHRLLKP